MSDNDEEGSEDDVRYDESSAEELVEITDNDSGEEIDEDEDPDGDDDDSDASDDADNDIFKEIVQHGAQQSDFQQPVSRASSPTLQRRGLFQTPVPGPKSYTIEPLIALPHPDATHALAASACMSHFLTGSEDGFIRDYDIFASANGKVLMSQQQRAHSGLQDPNLKAGTLRSWWENAYAEDPLAGATGPRSPVYSMAMQADALWGVSGTKEGAINLFSIRHEPGKIHHVLSGHTDTVSSMCLTHDEHGLLSAGWDGFALHWDLNTGGIARRYPSHGAQLTTIAMRPLNAPLPAHYNPYTTPNFAISGDMGVASNGDVSMESAKQNGSSHPKRSKKEHGSGAMSVDAEGDIDTDGDFDSLFDDNDSPTMSNAPHLMPGAASNGTNGLGANSLQMPGASVPPTRPPSTPHLVTAKHNTPILDPASYNDFSPDIFMTAGIDGQVTLWDRRVKDTEGKGAGLLPTPDKTPPWCVSACWSADGSKIMAGRRNGTIDVWDVRKYGPGSGQGQPTVFKTLKNPASSGSVVCVAAFPDTQHVVCASQDNLRLWNVASEEHDSGMARSRQSAPFKIIAGHHGIISQILIDPSSKFMITASGNRGWWGESTRAVIIHSIVPQP